MKFFKSREIDTKLMACYDASEAAEEALRLAQRYAEKWRAAIDVVAAVKTEDPMDPGKARDLETELTRKIKERFAGTEIPFSSHVLVQRFAVGEQLVMFCENRDYEFIFIGISKRSKTGKLLYGSTAQYIILNAPFPVISTNGMGRTHQPAESGG